MTASATRRALLAMVAALAAVALGVVLAGCGVPTMRSAEPLPTELVPGASTASALSSTTSVPSEVEPSLYFVEGQDQLRGVRRQAVSVDPEVEAKELLAQLVSGPSDGERAAGLATALSPGLTLELTSYDSGHAVVDVVGSNPGPAADQAHLAAGQVVLTLTGVPAIMTVSLTRNGRPLEAALPDGSLTSFPLTHDDYASLIVGR